MTSLNDDVTLKFRSARESAREWKKREKTKEVIVHTKTKKKTNYIFITIIAMITIIIAINYCQSSTTYYYWYCSLTV